MTREELKAHCKRQVQQFEQVEKIMPVTPNDWKRYEEHKLILELLEQAPCEAVSREAVLKVLREVSLTAENELELEFVAKQAIAGLPSVTPKQRTGKWIMRSKAWKEYYVCSVCGYGEDDELTQRTKFCPNCSAKMVEPQESEE